MLGYRTRMADRGRRQADFWEPVEAVPKKLRVHEKRFL